MKRALALVLVLITLACIVAGCSKQPSEVIDVLESTPAPVQSAVDPISLTMTPPAGIGMVAAGGLHTLGVRSDGTVVATGHDTTGQCLARNWNGISYAAASDLLSAGATFAGTVLVAGNDTLNTDVSTWTEILTVAAGSAHVLGLKADGTVMAAGDNAAGQCNVNAWSDIVAIAAAGNHSVGLKADGTVVATGDNAAGQCNVTDWSHVTGIAAGIGQTAAFTQEGAAYSTKNDVSAWAGITGIAAGENMTAGLTSTGTVECIPADTNAAAITDGVAISGGSNHAVVMKKDGSVAAFGSNDDFQCEVANWQLSPYVDGTYVMGFGPGMAASQVNAILSAFTGGAVTVQKDGAAAPDSELICTGMELVKDGAAYGTLVLLGDVNGDGIINAADGEAVSEHLDDDKDSTKLEGAFLRAACIKTDSSGNPTSAAVTAINAHSAGEVLISQFKPATVNKYDAKLAEAQAENPHVVGWIAIDGTNIDYPIMFHPKELWYYNTHDWKGDKAESGSIYSFYKIYSAHNVITGHNSRVSGTMFHQLHHIQEFNLGESKCAYEKCTSPDLTNAGLPDFSTYKGHIFTINIHGVEAQWEIFSMYETPGSAKYEQLEYNTWYHPSENWLTDPSDIQTWIDTQVTNSQFDFGVTPSPSDTFFTVYTCGNEHSDSSGGSYARLYFFLRKIS